MSSRAIDENLIDKSSAIMPCCQPLNEAPILTAGESELFPCCPNVGCPIEIEAGIIDEGSDTYLNVPAIEQAGGTFNLPSVNIAQGTPNIKLLVTMRAINGNVSVTGFAIAGDTVTPPPTLPIIIVAQDEYDYGMDIDTSVIGSYSITVTVTTVCNTFVFVQPFDIV